MADFFMISTRSVKKGLVEIYPKFIIGKVTDLMIRGGDFYAVWLDDQQLWSTDEQDALRMIDKELDIFAEEYRSQSDSIIKVMHLWDADTGMIDKWHKYCQKQMRDSFHMLDDKLTFANDICKKEDYISKRLPYPLEEGSIEAYDKLMNVLYSPEERMKIEWAVGAVISGDSKRIQKFLVLYGSAGTGKSTVLNIIQKLFDGYYSTFDAKSLGQSSNVFALEAFKTNPLVAIQHDGDLSRIEDNTRLNSLVSHELMTVNEKYKSTYSNRFNSFLFMGTNKPVKITDAKSGLIRRLIDVSPTGNRIKNKDYVYLNKQIDFELGAIAYHCLHVYLDNKNFYDKYIPVTMLDASNDFYNFVSDSYFVLSKEKNISLKLVWEMYVTYCDEARVSYPLSRRVFKEELKNYFEDYKDRYTLEDGTRIRSYYIGFKEDKFVEQAEDDTIDISKKQLKLEPIHSIFDDYCADCPAQYASDEGVPFKKWENVKTTLKDIDTSKLHYVKIPQNHIVIDFDIKDEQGNKSLEKNLEAASKWPATYSEFSKSGAGIHLHYIYEGDVTQLNRLYSEDIEIKVFTGNSSLRRKLTKCNDISIATLNSGLPIKEEKSVVNFEGLKNEKALRTLIIKNLHKECHPGTKPSVEFIKKILDDAYYSGMHYDVSDLQPSIIAFAASSTNHSDLCLEWTTQMKFKSEEPSDCVDSEKPIILYDIEIFPNLFVLCWKELDVGTVKRMINPSPSTLEPLLNFRLVGFNNRRYDNHLVYAAMLGYSNQNLYELSKRIINEKKGFFGEAYNLSFTDIYDFASAANKKSLKKLEIEMGIHHQELGLPWDQPVPEKLWDKVADYCCNDVIATEAAWHYLEADFQARVMLAELAPGSVNDSTNSLTTKLIFKGDKNPQNNFYYRDLSKPVHELAPEALRFLKEACPEMMAEPHGEAKSLLPYFPGYKYEYGVSSYKGVDKVGEGGRVYANPGIYGDVALLDIASMHPHSIIAEVLFGVKYTTRFKGLVDDRITIKHKAWNEEGNQIASELEPYIKKIEDGEITSKDMANALKTAINSVYGLTSAKFMNAFKDKRNVDNIVAKRGALFMIDLVEEVEKRGYTVVHIKTDSIKIADATPEIIKFVYDFGKRYGYTFEHEATYDRLCLVNNAVYIAKHATVEKCNKLYGYCPDDNKKAESSNTMWTATGEQFAVPYVFKTLFSHEPIIFDDYCSTISTKTGLLNLDMNYDLPDVSAYEAELDKLETKYKKGKISDTLFEPEACRLADEIEKGHNYIFVGKVGQFIPISNGGGVLLREQDGKYYAAGGTKGYRWLETETYNTINKAEPNKYIIDESYFQTLASDAIDAISKYGDFEWFAGDEEYISKEPDFVRVPNTDILTNEIDEVDEELPFI